MIKTKNSDSKNTIDSILNKLKLPEEYVQLLKKAPSVRMSQDYSELVKLSVKDVQADGFQTVSYEVPGKGPVKEATVCTVKNGISANFFEPYMRRRDPDCLFVGDEGPTDKPRFENAFGYPFENLRKETFDWLSQQNLLIFPFRSGQIEAGIPSLAIVPDNSAFFALALAQLQGIFDISKVDKFEAKCFLMVAPHFRHTHFKGKQVVVHNRPKNDNYEVFSYNLYPGPSAKKGIYGALLHYGEKEGWLVAHAAAVEVITPYDNKLTIMHESASGGGKSEMNEHVHREYDGSIIMGKNIRTQEVRHIVIPRGCNLRPVTDDMAICHPSIQKNNGKLCVHDAENAWFIRVDHIKNYGTDPDVEARSIHPDIPLLFLNIDAQPNSTALLWDHIEDAPGKTCSNPRFILPRSVVPDVVNKAISIDIRSFGVRTPPCTKENPSYGILGLFHILPPALAWLWRLTSPRGHENPSIVQKESGMHSEGVGSFWPFASGKKVALANILLKQIVDNPKTHFVLCPVKHVGAWSVGFVPQWIMREYLARRGGLRFGQHELSPSRCSLLGYTLNRLVIEGQHFEESLLKVEMQPEVGEAAYDQGAQQLLEFFHRELKNYLQTDLDPLGKKLIESCLNGGSLKDYNELLPGSSIFKED